MFSCSLDEQVVDQTLTWFFGRAGALGGCQIAVKRLDLGFELRE